MNSRPLCTVYNDPKDLETLTPSMLLQPRTDILSLPPGLEEGAKYYRYRWQHVQHLADVFWSRWRKEYLQMLQKRSKWHITGRNLKSGDLVLMMDKDTHRSEQPKAIILQTYPGEDGHVRVVKLKMTKGREYTRDVRRLALLECADNPTIQDDVLVQNNPETEND
jgi:hypothetical protein